MGKSDNTLDFPVVLGPEEALFVGGTLDQQIKSMPGLPSWVVFPVQSNRRKLKYLSGYGYPYPPTVEIKEERYRLRIDGIAHYDYIGE